MNTSTTLAPSQNAVLRQAELSAMWQQFKGRDCQKARTKLIEAYRHLVTITAGQLFGPLPGGVERDDLHGSGYVGLVKAVDQFDLSRGIKFETYAITLIRGAILEMLRGDDWVPRLVRDQQKQLKQAYIRLEARLGRPASEEEVAHEMGITPEKLDKLLGDIGRSSLLSLDALRLGSEEQRLGDLVPSQEPPCWEQAAVRERSERLQQAIAWLPPRERQVVRLYYQESKTFREIGGALGVSESRAYQLHAQALPRLRESLGEEALV